MVFCRLENGEIQEEDCRHKKHLVFGDDLTICHECLLFHKKAPPGLRPTTPRDTVSPAPHPIQEQAPKPKGNRRQEKERPYLREMVLVKRQEWDPEQGKLVERDVLWSRYTEAEWQEIENALRSARSKPKIPPELRDELTDLAQFYVLYREQEKGAPRASQVRTVLKKISKAGKEFARSLSQGDDGILDDESLSQLGDAFWRANLFKGISLPFPAGEKIQDISGVILKWQSRFPADSMWDLVERAEQDSRLIAAYADKLLRSLKDPGGPKRSPGFYECIQNFSWHYTTITGQASRPATYVDQKGKAQYCGSYVRYMDAVFTPIDPLWKTKTWSSKADIIKKALAAVKQ